jgi:hypothetical protein
LALLRSCVRVALFTAATRENAAARAGGVDEFCSVRGEPCCDASFASLRAVFHLTAAGGAMSYLAANSTERAAAVALGFSDACAPSGAAFGDFCTGGVSLGRTPFVVSNSSTAGPMLRRCQSFDGGWYVSTAADCDGRGLNPVGVGWISQAPSAEFPLALTRCSGGGDTRRYVVVGGGCDAGDSSEGVLGYVA